MARVDDIRGDAIRVRRARASIRHELKQGRILPADVLRKPPRVIWEVPTYRVLLWVPRLGPDRLALLNDDAILARVNLAMPIVTLTAREREWLVERVGRRLAATGGSTT